MIAIGIFAKPPQPGQVKTRLIPDIGADNATRVYRYCLEHALRICRGSDLEHRLYLADHSDDELFVDEHYLLQQGGDLGQRMQYAFESLLADNDGAIIIGTDCLDITCQHLHQAAQALDSHELVLLPAEDGGYALIGCSRFEAQVFHNVRWSSDQVLEQTLANAESLKYRVSLLETVRDIDTLHDLNHYPELLALIG